MIFKYKLQILEGIVYTKSSLTFLFIQTYKFLQTTKKKKKKKKRKKKEKKEIKEERKKNEKKSILMERLCAIVYF